LICLIIFGDEVQNMKLLIVQLPPFFCDSTHCEQFCGCIRWSIWWTGHKLRIVAVMTMQISLWLVLWGMLKEKMCCEQSVVFGRTLRKC
jgi:hypothetical protein